MSTGAPLQALEDWAGALLQRLAPAARRRLAMQVAQQLRRSQQKHMRAEQGPDGAAWEPRKAPTQSLRTRRSTLRDTKTGPMMRGLAQAKYLRAQATPTEATVAFADRVQRIATVHHFGETDAVNNPNPPRYDYPARPLLGISDDDLQAITELLLNHLQG